MIPRKLAIRAAKLPWHFPAQDHCKGAPCTSGIAKRSRDLTRVRARSVTLGTVGISRLGKIGESTLHIGAGSRHESGADLFGYVTFYHGPVIIGHTFSIPFLS